MAARLPAEAFSSAQSIFLSSLALEGHMWPKVKEKNVPDEKKDTRLLDSYTLPPLVPAKSEPSPALPWESSD